MKQKYLTAFLLLALFIGYSYSNTLDASWHLDDIPNIIDNTYLHLDDMAGKSLINALYSNPRNPNQLNENMYRPVACFSLALNWYFGKNNVLGYHLVNIAVHLINAFFLFLFLFTLFQTPRLKKDFFGIETAFSKLFFVAFYAALLWAVHPIQTQAVTYIVQRMASMAAMFYIMGMFAYLKGRAATIKSKRWFWYFGCAACFILSFNSKQNGIMLPMSLLLIESIFFHNFSKKTLKKLFAATFLVGIILLLLTILIVPSNHSILTLYDLRTFTLMERLLVQPRVLSFHLSQIFYPLPERFSIAHDFILSSSLLTPWTTLPSFLLIFTMIGFGLHEIRRHPLLSFAILFFFLNHLIESTIIPLEIVFEHRNYLPSMFLFLPLSFWLGKRLSAYHHQKDRLKVSVIIIFSIAIAFGFSVSTHIRNKVWENDILLWTDAHKKAPINARAVDILATNLAWGKKCNQPNRYDKAIDLFEKALTLDMPSLGKKADILGNMASIYSNNKHDYKKAIQLYKKALIIKPDHIKIRHDMVKTLILSGDYDEALENIALLISKNNNNWAYHNLKGFCLLWLGKYEEAFPNFQQALRLFPGKKNVLFKGLILNMGVNLSLKGEYEFTNEVLGDLIKDDMLKKKFDLDNLPIYFALIENNLRAQDIIKAQKYASQMLIIFGKNIALENIDKLAGNRSLPPISKNILESVRIELKMH